MLRQITFGLIPALSVLAMTSFAQPPGRPGGSNSATSQVSSGFERSAPDVGDPLPDVSGYDADGKEFKLSSLKGHYSVLVFGCLT